MNLAKHHRDKKPVKVVVGGTASCDPSIVYNNSIRIDWGDGTVTDEALFGTNVHSYADTADYTILFDSRRQTDFRGIAMNSDDVKSLDLTHAINLQGGVNFTSNLNLTEVIWPAVHNPTANITDLDFGQTGITGIVDISVLADISGTIEFHNCDNMTELLHTGSTQTTLNNFITLLYSNANLTKIDLSGIKRLTGQLQMRQNPNLTEITLPDNSLATGSMSILNTYQCPNLTTLDLTPIKNLGGNLRFYQCGSLTTLTMPPTTTNGDINDIWFYQNTVLTELDMSTWDGDIGQTQYRGYDCPNLTTFRPHTTSGQGRITVFWMWRNGLTTIDLSNTKVVNNIRVFECDNLTQITFRSTPIEGQFVTNSFALYRNQLSQTLDLTMFPRLSGSISLYENPDLHTILWPTSIDTTNTVTTLDMNNCGYVGVNDMSTMTQASYGTLDISGNPLMTSFITPITGRINDFYCDGNTGITSLDFTNIAGGFRILVCGGMTSLTSVTFNPATVWAGSDLISTNFSDSLISTIDFSPLTNMGGLIYTTNCPNLTSITFPTSSVVCTDMRGYNSALTSLDLSPLSGFSGRVEYNDNAMTSLTFPTTATGAFTNFFFYDNLLGYVDLKPLTGSTFGSVSFRKNGMTAAEVNQMLVEFEAMVGTVTGSKFFTIGSASGDETNAAPDATSGGFDGLQAVIDLQAKGWTVQTS